MGWIDPSSLTRTLEAVQDAALFGRDVPRDVMNRVVVDFVSRIDLPGAYRDGFVAPSRVDVGNTFRTFLGYSLPRPACASHLLGQEAAFLTARFAAAGACGEYVLDGIRRFHHSLRSLQGHAQRHCCIYCNLALWRGLGAVGEKADSADLAAGFRHLSARRDGTGEWIGYPFFETLRTLTELPPEIAQDELAYASPAIERRLLRDRSDVPFARRRRAISVWALAAV